MGRNKGKIWAGLLLAAILIGFFMFLSGDGKKYEELLLATTTSTQDSGLLDVLLPVFEEEYHIKVKVVAVGSGQAMELGKRGDADVLLVHSPEAEAEFMKEGWGIKRYPVMHNRFVLAGPPDNPAGINSQDGIITALRKIAQKEACFVSRSDNSGTHVREMSLWEKAGIKPKGDWYLETGQGMGETLLVAEEKRGYVLTDEAAYLAFCRQGKINLKVWVAEGEELFNNYSVIAVNPDKHAHVNYKGAQKFIEFMTSREGQAIIREFGVKEYGKALFIPDAE